MHRVLLQTTCYVSRLKLWNFFCYLCCSLYGWFEKCFHYYQQFFLVIYWLSQNQRKYFWKVWVWICHWDPSSLSLTTTEFMLVEFCLTLQRANSLHILDVLFFRNNSGLYALSCREFRFAVFQKPSTRIIIQLRSISCKVVLYSLSKSD